MMAIVIDKSLYCKFENYELVGVIGSYVDDSLSAESEKWNLTQTQLLKYLRPLEKSNHGSPISSRHITDKGNILYIDQDFYINKNKQARNGADLTVFASMRLELT